MTDIKPTTPTAATASGNAPRPVLEINDLSVSFNGRSGNHLALKGVSFTLNKGEVVAVVGESGSGKSVTSLTVMGLLASAAHIERGAIRFTTRGGEQHSLLQMKDDARRQLRGREMSMIFQEPMTSLNPVLKVGDQLTEALLDHQICDAAAAVGKARELLRKVRIADVDRVMNSYPHSLSGGMRQRVMIAQALACDPQLLIADEPTTALDVTVQARILQILRDLQQQSDMAVLFITHDMGVVAEIADRVVVMYRGEVVEEGAVEAIFTAPQHPYTQALLTAVPKLGDMENSRWPRRFPLLGQSQPAPESDHVTARYDAPPLLDIRGLKVYYPVRTGILSHVTHHVHAVEQIDFSVWPGETLAIVGESGCGKSTTGRALLRLVDSESESIQFQGKEVSLVKDKAFQPLRRKMQMVFQDPYASLNPRLTVGFTIAEPLMLHGLVKSLEEATPQVQALLKSVGLEPEHAQRYPHEFSGGQRQRIAIARAMALKPEVIIADEAVSALDVSIQAQVVNLMMDLQQKTGVSWIFISHDMAVVERIANRVAVMYLGKIVEIGPRQSVFNNPQHPYTRRLLASVPVADPRRRSERQLDDSEIPSPLRKAGESVPKSKYRQVAPHHWVSTDDSNA
ncbi:glutathione ABC transporter ATP-binding protein [Lonsdalea populi]|uniref:ABC transporter ATP-binding protein n=1 Tax=Lonsdalea TaxID=1082702 RepID=UPI000A1D97AB|nr:MULTISPECIES: ABC transporter ATP-binding protein [Lonsdalea]OSN01184.1 glutathione ABC transporter ATP-binding protein [Lonsdalea populi]QPQ24331.1 ABC transporter ATP-binding protein [Lonsdalea populi]RAT18429.1 glutathione ABC transporter ATP-binding protein [Lonsdalea quercina]RAT29896.1 glutathione ABC transporter ATP-binding protein [Lonsdalea populi]RAT39576.1 glutathione ABC transporter ATP-binding protein [Lonsdalea populi]